MRTQHKHLNDLIQKARLNAEWLQRQLRAAYRALPADVPTYVDRVEHYRTHNNILIDDIINQLGAVAHGNAEAQANMFRNQLDQLDAQQRRNREDDLHLLIITAHRNGEDVTDYLDELVQLDDVALEEAGLESWDDEE